MAADDERLLKDLPIAPGLCGRCRHGRLVVSGRGSRFLLCERSKADHRFPRYPALPVFECLGFQDPE